MESYLTQLKQKGQDQSDDALKDQIERMTFYSPPQYQQSQKQINSLLKNIEAHFEKMDKSK